MIKNTIKISGLLILLTSSIFLADFKAWGLEQQISQGLQEKFNREITLDLRDMDIVDVFKFLSLKGDFSIVVSKTVTGRVTLVLKSVKIGDALDIIAISNGLGYRAKENIIYVMPEEEYTLTYGKMYRDKTIVKIVYLQYAKPSYALETLKNVKSEVGKIIIDEDTGTVVMVDTEENIQQMQMVLREIDYKLETRIFNLNHAKADVVKEKLRERLDVKSVGSIQSDERSNQVIVTALPARMPEVEEIIKALDKKTKEVLLKLQILKIILNPKFDFGIDWEKSFTRSKNKLLQSLDFHGAFPIASAVSSSTALGTVGKIAIGNLAANEITAEIKALKQVSDTKVLANPQILVANEQEAMVHIGDKLAYVTVTTTGTGADQTQSAEVHFLDIGIQLHVKPVIGDDGFIRIYIKPEISSQNGELTYTVGTTANPITNKVPIINTTLIETNAMVKDGYTMILGGLHKDEVSKSRKGIPFLMDIPFLGKVFGSQADSVTKTEIVIFLTPHIVGGEEDLSGYKPELEPMKEY